MTQRKIRHKKSARKLKINNTSAKRLLTLCLKPQTFQWQLSNSQWIPMIASRTRLIRTKIRNTSCTDSVFCKLTQLKRLPTQGSFYQAILVSTRKHSRILSRASFSIIQEMANGKVRTTPTYLQQITSNRKTRTSWVFYSILLVSFPPMVTLIDFLFQWVILE